MLHSAVGIPPLQNYPAMDGSMVTHEAALCNLLVINPTVSNCYCYFIIHVGDDATLPLTRSTCDEALLLWLMNVEHLKII